MLLHVISDPVQTEVMMICSIAIQGLSVAMLWRDIQWKMLAYFLLGGGAGLPVGVWLLLHFGATTFKEAVGAVLATYALYGLLKRPVTVETRSRAVDVAIGWAGGITGGLAGFPGAPVTVWCGMRGWDKHRQRGIY